MVLQIEAASTRARSTDHATTIREALKTTVMDTDTGEERQRGIFQIIMEFSVITI